MLLDSKVLLLLLLVAAHRVTAYSWDGHAIVANVAWNLISEETKATVEEILARSEHFYNSLIREPCDGVCTPLGEMAKWADDARDDDEAFEVYGYTDPMHYIEIPDDEVSCPILADDDVNECWFDYDRDCPEDACSVGGINCYSLHLQQEHRQRHLFWIALNRMVFWDSVKESLLFLTHFFGDLHQPLHSCRKTDYCGDWIHVTFIDQDRYNLPEGWTKFICSLPIIGDLLGSKCTGRQLHLHKVWDRMIIKKTIADDFGGSRYALEQDLLQYIEDSHQKRDEEWLACPDATDQDCVMGWANHELELALRYAYRDVDGSEVQEGTVLTEAYYIRALPIVREQLAAAAVRFAYTLDTVLV